MNTLQTVLLSILVLLETIRLVILLGTVTKNKEIADNNRLILRVYRKFEYWLDREDEREDGE